MLMDNKIEIMELQKRQTYENDSIRVILCEFFSRYLCDADRVLKIVKKNSYKTIINTKEFNEDLIKSKKFIFENLKSNERNSYSPLLNHCILMILVTNVKELIELDIRSLQSIICSMILELLKKLTSLQILKFSIFNDGEFNLVYPKILKEITPTLKSIKRIDCQLKNSYDLEIPELFDYLPNNINLKKLKLDNFRLSKTTYQDKVLGNMLSNSKLIYLSLSNTTILYTHFVHLAKGLKKNKTITCLKIKNIMIREDFFGKIYDFEYNLAFIEILKSIESKNYFEKITLYPLSIVNYDLIDYVHNFIEFKKFPRLCIETIKRLLSNNQKLKKFNVYIAVSNNFIIKFSEILLEGIKKNENLKIVNKIRIEKLLDYKKALVLAFDYFHKIVNWRDNSLNFKIDEGKSGIFECMPIVVSELFKHSNEFTLNNLLKRLFQKNIDMKSKILNLTEINKNYKTNCQIYLYNFLEVFTYLEVLILSNEKMASVVIEVIEKNIQKLKNLHTIKIWNLSNKSADISSFLGAENLLYFKVISGTLKISTFENSLKKIKSSKIEKITFKSLNFEGNDLKNMYLLLKYICRSSLKALKIYTKFTPDLLNLLVRNLYTFVNIEFIGLNLLEDYKLFENSIKDLISLVQSKKTRLSKIKVQNYIWDIEKLQGKNSMEIVRSKLSPIDLMILVELCENNILKDIDYINLSNNKGIIDDSFIGNMVRFINALGCSEVMIKRSGCAQSHKKEIKSSIEKKSASALKFRI